MYFIIKFILDIQIHHISLVSLVNPFYYFMKSLYHISYTQFVFNWLYWPHYIHADEGALEALEASAICLYLSRMPLNLSIYEPV